MNVWRNGQIVPAKGAVDADDRGVLLGDGIFETMAVIDGRPLRLDRHLARLTQGARLLGLAVPADRPAIHRAVCDLFAADALAEGAARLTLLRGRGPRGLLPPAQPTPTLIIATAGAVVGDVSPLRLIVATSTRKNERSPLAGIKSTNYLDAIIARQEAAAGGADDAVLLNSHDRVAEATTSNIFCVIGGDIVTPPLSDGALPGIMRASVMACEDVIERSLTAEDLRRAEEIFVSSSLSVRPVIAVDGAPVGNGAPGAVALRLGDLPRRAG